MTAELKKPQAKPFEPLIEKLKAREFSGLAFCHAYSDLMDETLRSLGADIFAATPDLCLMALGGYGRRELCPYSDIDLMFFSLKDMGEVENKAIEKFLYALWDKGLKVGHCVRNLQDCLTLARKDSKILTGLLDARTVCGDEDAGGLMVKEITLLFSQDEKLIFMQDKLDERDERHIKYVDTRYVLEPNIKEGKGGLRDFQTLHWITNVLYGARSLQDLVGLGILTASEARRFEKSHNFLLTVRCHLHQIAGRAEERLHFDVQPDLAERLGYTSRHTGRAVERFMKHYFLVTRDIGDFTRILCAAIAHENAKTENDEPGFEGFETLDSRLTFGKEQNIQADPLLMIRIFQALQQTGKDIHPFALKEITRNIRKINDDLRNDAQANEVFLQILTGKDPALILRRMNEAGVLGAFMTDFGKIIALMQFDRYHHFTVDEHILRCIETMHKLEHGFLQDEAPISTRIAQGVSDRKSLYVALLLHDICKGRGGKHAELGAELALSLCPRLGLDGDETDLVSWLVGEHLLMSDTAFRRNMNDPKTIADFSARIRTEERLNMLFVLTTADIMGVGPGRWTAWKARLLEELYLKTCALMKGEEPGMVMELSLPQDLNPGDTRIDINTDVNLSATIVIVYTPDRPGLFATLCGALSAEGADIMRAYINTLPGRMAVDRFIIQNATGLPFVQERRQEDIRQSILHALGGSLDIAAKMDGHKKEMSREDMVFNIPPKISINNTASGTDTVIEVETRDRHGLLYDIACTLREEGLDIRAAKINTHGLRAIDSFYVQTVKRKKLMDIKGQERMIERLTETVAKP